MYFFTRRTGQKLRIGDDIVMSVQRVRGGSVRLGFDVPPHVSVDREEIAEFKKREGIASNLNYTADHEMPESAEQPPGKSTPQGQ